MLQIDKVMSRREMEVSFLHIGLQMIETSRSKVTFEVLGRL